MKNIYTWAARPAKRTLTVADLKLAKGKKKFTQVTANTIDEASAAEKAGFDMMICQAKNVLKVREGSKHLFLTASLILNEYVTKEDVLRGAFKSLENGADAVMTPRSMEVVPIVNTLDDPLTEVIALDNIPPVHDSATAILSFFLFNNETIFWFKLIRKILL